MEYFNFELIVFIIQTILWFNIGTVKAIVNGLNADEGRFPYQVSIQVNRIHVCGGAIISKNHVLSAAHCIINNDNYFNTAEFTVVAGIIKFDSAENHRYKVIIEVDKIYIPSDFKYANRMIQDISVLKLKKALKLGVNHAVNKVRLPVVSATNIAILSNYINTEPEIAGFGADSVNVYTDSDGKECFEVGPNSNHLKYVKTKVTSNLKCIFYTVSMIKASHLCAYTQQPDPPRNSRGVCVGDSGGALVANHDVVVGILSTGPSNCDESHLPALYTRVTYFLPFIQNAMKDRISPDIRVIDKSR